MDFTMNVTASSEVDGNGTLVVTKPEVLFSAAYIIFWIVVFIGFIFSFVTTISLLFTKEVKKGDVYITLGIMTFSELVVYVTFLILLGLSTFPGNDPVPYLCLVLNTIVGLFKGFSLSLAIYLTTERIVAVACPRVYRFSKKPYVRSILQALLFICDVSFFFTVNFFYGKRDSDFGCTLDMVYHGSIDRVMTILRANSILKMAIILIMCAAVSILLRRKIKAVNSIGDGIGQAENKGTKDLKRPIKENRDNLINSADNPPSCSFQREINASTSATSSKQNTKTSNGRSVFLIPYQVSDVTETSTNTTKIYSEGSTNMDVTLQTLKIPPTSNNTTGNHGKSKQSNPRSKKMPFWMKESYKTVSYYLLSYVVVYLPSIVYMTTMVCFPSIKEDGVSRGINFLTPCVHSIVASFIYIFRVREMNQGLWCRKRNNDNSES